MLQRGERRGRFPQGVWPVWGRVDKEGECTRAPVPGVAGFHSRIMSVTVDDILQAARGGLSVPPETIGYLVLGAADRACQASPATFEIRDIELDERGAVTVPGIRPTEQDRVAQLLRDVLSELLRYAATSATALARIGRATDDRTASRLIREIEAALIPVNRSAGRRALARLHRDVERVRRSRVPLLPAP